MPENTTYVEFVKFSAQGLDEVEARTKAYAQQVSELERRNRLLAGALKDPAYARHAADVNRLAREYERLKYAANVQALVAEHGKFGAAMRLTADHFGKIKSAALIGLGAVSAFGVGLMRSGLQGTVEGYRLELAWTRLGRQAAGIALPAIEKLTNWVAKAANWFGKLSGSQQDTILTFGLLSAGAVTLSGALSGVASMVSLAVSGGKALYAAYTAVAGAYTASAAAATAYAGAEAAATRVRVVGVTSAAASAGVNGAAALGAGAPLALAGGGMLYLNGGKPNALPGKGGPLALPGGGGASRFAGAGRVAAGVGRIAAPLAAGYAVYEGATGDYYAGLRGKGNNRLVSGLGALGGGFADLLTLGEFSRHYAAKNAAAIAKFRGLPEPGSEHRDVTPLGMGFGELGGTWFKLQEEFLKQGMVKAEDERRKAEESKKTDELVKQAQDTNTKLDAILVLSQMLTGGNLVSGASGFLGRQMNR